MRRIWFREKVSSLRFRQQTSARAFSFEARGRSPSSHRRTARVWRLPYGLANAVVTIERRYNPRISNGGTLALMQINQLTTRCVGFNGSAVSPPNPDINLHYGMRCLAVEYRQSGAISAPRSHSTNRRSRLLQQISAANDKPLTNETDRLVRCQPLALIGHSIRLSDLSNFLRTGHSPNRSRTGRSRARKKVDQHQCKIRLPL